MSDIMETSEPIPEPSTEGRPWTILIFLTFTAIGAWLLSLMLADHVPLVGAGTPGYWWYYIQQILRDLLRTGAIVAAALVLASFVPGLGLLLERMVFRSPRALFLAVTVLFAVLTCGLFSYVSLQHLPHIQDEVAMDFQARVLASGRLYVPTPRLIDFFDCEFIVVDGPRWYGKYFLGPALIMAPGAWFGAVWAVNPLISGLVVYLTYVLARALLSEKSARVATVLIALSSMRTFTCAMIMSHAGCMACIALAGIGVVKVLEDPRRAGWAAAAGAGLGFAFNFRPLTAAAVGLAAGVVSAIAMPWRRLSVTTVVAFAATLLAFMVIFLGYNKVLTGSALVTPFERWSPGDRPGFGADIGTEYWPATDRGHSFGKALFTITQMNMQALGDHLTGWGHAALILMFGAALSTRWRGRARGLLLVSVSLMVAYFFYLTSSILLGQPRYWSETLPMMIVLVTISLASVRQGLPRVARALGLLPAVRTGRAACWTAGLLLAIFSYPRAYRPVIENCGVAFLAGGGHLRDLVQQERLDNALVFIRAFHYREHAHEHKFDDYVRGFSFNDVDLQGPVLFARDLGEPRNQELIAAYPGRKLYWYDPGMGTLASLEPYEEHLRRLSSETAPAPASAPESAPSK